MGSYYPAIPFTPPEEDSYDDDILDLDIPDVEIEYQEDDENDKCDGGGCAI